MILLDTYSAGDRLPNKALLWEYDINTFDWQKSKRLVVQRVIEMGTPEDFFAAFDLYGGINGVREIVKSNTIYHHPINKTLERLVSLV